MLFDSAALRRLIPDPFLRVAPDGVIQDASVAAATELGLTRKELLGQRLADLCDDPGAAARFVRTCFRSSGPTPGALRFASGHAFRCRATRIEDPHGSAAVVIAMQPRSEPDNYVLLGQKIAELNHEVARRKQAEAAMVRLQDFTGALVAAPELRQVATVVVERGVTAAKASAAVLFLPADGHSLEGGLHVMGTGADGAEPPVVTADDASPVAEVFRSGEARFLSSLEGPDRRSSGSCNPRQGAAACAVLPLSTASGCVGVLRFEYDHGREFEAHERELLRVLADQCGEAVQRVRLFEAERRARARASRAEQKKDEFLAMLSHELRNPLAPILTAVELMQLRGDAVFERERAIIERQAKHLTSLVDDLLDISRITRGKVELNRGRQELSLAVDRAIESHGPLLDKRAIRLTVDVPRRGLVLDADHDRLVQIIGNLLGNAAKYSDPGGEVDIRAEVQGGDRVVLRVRDRGKGIDPAQLPGLFEMFNQAGRDDARSDGGLGLGLAIVRSLVELHDGTVTAHSEGIGRGSEFVVRLPGLCEDVQDEVAAIDAAQPRKATASGKGARVLIVEDNEDAAQLLAEGLSAEGYIPRSVPDAAAALRAIDDFRPDVALLDISLPGMDGYELAQRLRQRPDLRAVPFIAVTAYGQQKDKERAIAAGFAAHVVKPVDLQTLSKQIGRLLTARRTAEPEAWQSS